MSSLSNNHYLMKLPTKPKQTSLWGGSCNASTQTTWVITPHWRCHHHSPVNSRRQPFSHLQLSTHLKPISRRYTKSNTNVTDMESSSINRSSASTAGISTVTSAYSPSRRWWWTRSASTGTSSISLPLRGLTRGATHIRHSERKWLWN